MAPVAALVLQKTHANDRRGLSDGHGLCCTLTPRFGLDYGTVRRQLRHRLHQQLTLVGGLVAFL
jgi:hypothetical protein